MGVNKRCLWTLLCKSNHQQSIVLHEVLNFLPACRLYFLFYFLFNFPFLHFIIITFLHFPQQVFALLCNEFLEIKWFEVGDILELPIGVALLC